MALFTSPVWTGSHPHYRSRPGPGIIRDAKFWLPLLGLFRGARLEEMADLYRRDIQQDEGTYLIDITDESRSLKNSNARRSVPLHPELICMGFIQYVEAIAPQAADPIFPDLEPQGSSQKRGPRFTRWFVHYRRALGIYRDDVGMHSFRHTAITRLTDAITTYQEKRRRDYMMGHGGAGTEGDMRYDKGAGLKALAATLSLLIYPELDLSHLHLLKSPNIKQG